MCKPIIVVFAKLSVLVLVQGSFTYCNGFSTIKLNAGKALNDLNYRHHNNYIDINLKNKIENEK
jgi:hypothetical protein